MVKLAVTTTITMGIECHLYSPVRWNIVGCKSVFIAGITARGARELALHAWRYVH